MEVIRVRLDHGGEAPMTGLVVLEEEEERSLSLFPLASPSLPPTPIHQRKAM